MQVLLYNELNPQAIQGFAKWQKFMEADDLKSADVKKIGDNLYRARLNRTVRRLIESIGKLSRHRAPYLVCLTQISHRNPYAPPDF